MHLVPIGSVLVLLLAAGLQAETHSEVMYDNEHVRVVKTTMEPRQPSALQQQDLDRVLICLDSGQMTNTTPDGKVEKVDFAAREVRWIPRGGSVVRENVGDKAFQIIEIELKGKTQPAVTVTGLDPLKVDPNHYQLVLENDRTRVVRVRFGPLEDGVVHQHVRNYVVVYMTDQRRGKKGDVRLHLDEGSVTHTENNPLDQPVERIAVELK